MATRNADELFGHFIYVCGTDYGKDRKKAIKEKITAELASLCFTRSSPRCYTSDMDLYSAYHSIVSSGAFVFFLNNQSISDMNCLNQFGIAMSYNVPTVTFREPDFSLPKPLPMRFYQTEIIDKSEQSLLIKTLPSSHFDNLPAIATLANALVQAYENAVVYSPRNHKLSMEDLVRVLKSSCRISPYIESREDNVSDVSSSSDESTIPNGSTMSGLRFSAQKLKKESPASAKSSVKFQSLRPQSKSSSVASSSSPKFIAVVPPSPRLLTPPVYKKLQSGVVGRKVVTSHRLSYQNGHVRSAQPSEKSKSNKLANSPYHGQKPLIRLPNNTLMKDRHDTPKRTTQHENDVIVNGLKVNGNILPTEKRTTQATQRKAQLHTTLRRHSSLPIIPTQYLIAPKHNNEAPRVYAYPPLANDPVLQTSLGSPMLSGDEEDIDLIHISRTCTPFDVETDFTNASTPTSPGLEIQ